MSGAATPNEALRDHIMNPNVPKSETEHWAARRIEELESRVVSAPLGEPGGEAPPRFRERVNELLDTANRYLQRARDAEAARDHADRRAGAAERHNETLEDDAQRRASWLSGAKVAAGYPQSVSYDVVWAETLEKARQGPFTRQELKHILHLVEGGNGGTKPGGRFSAQDVLELRAKLKGMT